MCLKELMQYDVSDQARANEKVKCYRILFIFNTMQKWNLEVAIE